MRSSRASETQWIRVTETNFDQRWEAALDDELLGLPPGSEEGRLLARILTDARRRRAFRGGPKLPSEMLRLASSAEGRTLFSKAFAQRVAEGEVLPVDAAADEGSPKGFAARQRRASPEDSTDDSAEKPDEFPSAEAHRKPRLWWAADGWWLEWPRADGSWRRPRSAFIPLPNRFYCLTVTNRTKEKSSFCGRQRSLRLQRFSDFRRLRRLHREN